MNIIDQIKSRLGQDDAREHIRELIGTGGRPHRKALAKSLCDTFNFYDQLGCRQVSNCMQALRELESEGAFSLAPSKLRRGQKVPVPVDVPGRVDKISELQLILVETEQDRKVWNELMINEHPLGVGWTGGRTIRYLVSSEHGVLGAVGFAPSALELADREQWIGWNKHQKDMNLQRIVGMNLCM